MTNQFRPVMIQALRGKLSPWNGFKIEQVDLCRIRDMYVSKRIFCISDRHLPYTLHLDYYAGTSQLAWTGHLWLAIPKEYEYVTFRYPSEYAAEEDLNIIRRRLDLIHEAYKCYVVKCKDKSCSNIVEGTFCNKAAQGTCCSTKCKITK